MGTLIGQKLGNYELTNLLGRGGTSEVYRGRNTITDESYAIKVLFSDEEGLGQRFRREAESTAKLDHPNIRKVIEFGQQGQTLYMVVPLLPGNSVATLIQDKALTSDYSVTLLRQIASALDYAHGCGVIHRDLKPENILLDTDGNAVLTDFGMAKSTSPQEGLTRTGMVLGTPHYMAPEQCRGQPIDKRADIYALGVTFFEMLAGELPFDSKSPMGIMNMHVNKEAPAITSKNAALPSSLDPVIAKALAKKPEDRYSCASDFYNAIVAILGEGKPSIIKRTTSLPAKTSLIALAAVIIAVLIITVLFVIWLTH